MSDHNGSRRGIRVQRRVKARWQAALCNIGCKVTDRKEQHDKKGSR